MTRDDLEAVIRRELGRAALYGVHSRRTEHQNESTDKILAAADAYMVAEGGLAAERRAVLEQAATRRKAR